MDRIKQATPATISNSWYSGGTLADPGTVTLGVTAADGTVVVAPGTATSGGGAAARTFNLTATHTASLNNLTATWTTSTLGTDTTVHQIVGDFLFTTDQLKTLVPTATDDQASKARIYAETALERALGYALVPRYARDTKVVRAACRLRLRPFVRTIRSATNGGTALAQANIDRLLFEPGGWVSGYYRWNGRVVIAYEHGLDTDNDLSAGANRAALNIALDYLGATVDDIDPRATRLITDDGTLELATSAQGQFSSPVVNRWVNANALPRAA